MKWGEKRLLQALLGLYDENRGYVMLPQVPDGTGMAKTRTADAVAMQVWPSRGLRLYGFEMKTSRSDWRRELNRAEKAESIASYCHYWYIVAPKGIVPIEELPPLWGLIEVDDKDKAKHRRKAPEQEQVAVVDMGFLAGVLRAASKAFNTEAELRKARSEGRAQGYDDGFAAGEKRHEHEKEQAQKVIERARQLERLTGIDLLNRFQPTDVQRRAIRSALSRNGELENRMKVLRRTAHDIATEIDRVLGEGEA